MNYKEAARKTVVTSVRVSHFKADDPMFPHWAVPEGKLVDEVWWGAITTRTGLLPEQTKLMVFWSGEDAASFVERHPIGCEIGRLAWEGMEAKRHERLRNMIDAGFAPGVSNAGDEESSLAFDVLEKAGVLGAGYCTAQHVLDFLGRQRVGALKSRYRDNWSTAAEFEYCSIKYPPSSPAYVAAAYQFHWYITRDEFAAGYLWRDLECLVHGVEAAALKSVEMRRKAGAKGSAKSAAARAARRSGLFAEMENVAQRNPDIAQLGVVPLVNLALQSCVQKDPALWSQGSGQVGEYLNEIRWGDAGEEMKARYLEMFPEKRSPVERTA